MPSSPLRRALATALLVLLPASAALAGETRETTSSNTIAATSVMQFGAWVGDPSGEDHFGDNKQINRETIVVKNTGTTRVTLAGWTVKDKHGFTFVFPSGYTLAAGQSTTIHTGKGTNTWNHLYWKQGSYVWNNTGDTAYLRSPGGTLKDSCVWDGSGSGRTC